MDSTGRSPLEVDVATRMRAASADIAQQWIAQAADRADAAGGRGVDRDELIVPATDLVNAIADAIGADSDTASRDVLAAKADEFARHRLEHGDVDELLEEYGLLGDVLFDFARGAIEHNADVDVAATVACSQRIFDTMSHIAHAAAVHYVRTTGEQVAEREERLRRFGRMITHELKNRVGATLGAGQLLREEWLGAEERIRFAGMVEDNAHAIRTALENMSAVTSVDAGKRRARELPLSEIVAEVIDHLRGLARARGVHLRVAGELPDIEVNANAAELCLSNYLANSIRFSDMSADERWAEVEASIESDTSDTAGAADGSDVGTATAAGTAGGADIIDTTGNADGADATPEKVGPRLTVRVRDNGIGVPAESRDQLFERFFRAHPDHDGIEGTGLGLSLVRATVAALGGRAWAEFDGEHGAVFAFSLPVGENGRPKGGHKTSAA
jgi:signal transduction histidine kinase